MSREGKRLLKLMGYNPEGDLINNIGLEQEIFLTTRSAFYNRPDLQLTGRAVMGKGSCERPRNVGPLHGPNLSRNECF